MPGSAPYPTAYYSHYNIMKRNPELPCAVLKTNQSSLNFCSKEHVKYIVVAVAIWSVVFAMLEICVFSWQTPKLLHQYHEEVKHSAESDVQYPGYFGIFYETPQAKYYSFIFIIQFLIITSSVCLLIASLFMIFAIIYQKKMYLIWYFPSVLGNILMSLAYSTIWWITGIDFRLNPLTVIVFLSAIPMNTFMAICMVVAYRKFNTASLQISGRRESFQPNMETQKHSVKSTSEIFF